MYISNIYFVLQTMYLVSSNEYVTISTWTSQIQPWGLSPEDQIKKKTERSELQVISENTNPYL